MAMGSGLKKVKRFDNLTFKIGTTSYIYPATILENINRLKGSIGDIELVLFEDPACGNIPTPAEIKELKRLSKRWGFSYTVHLPLEIGLGAKRDAERIRSIGTVTRLTRYLKGLAPQSYIMHVNLPEECKDDITSWQSRAGESLDLLMRRDLSLAKHIAIENLGYPFSYNDPVLSSSGASVCVDIGHLVKSGIDVMGHLDKYYALTRVIHLHGVDCGKDHISLKYFSKTLLNDILLFLEARAYRGVLTIEVFSRPDLEESLEILWESLYS
ncbi:MAG: cobamide remodeling phosphodiesterase CbiR [Candidatus Omnitrophota bacterium]